MNISLSQKSLLSSGPLLRRPFVRKRVNFLGTNFSTDDSSYGKPIRWGILSAGQIASDFAKAVSYTNGAEVAAIGARSASRAAAFATEHHIPQSYGSYEELIHDPSIDVVYIGTIADTHAELAEQSLLAKKPTVVEKPVTLCYDDTKRLIDLAREQQVFFM